MIADPACLLPAAPPDQPRFLAIGLEMTGSRQPQRSELTAPYSVDQRADLTVEIVTGQ
jgi:hypothetical protein